MARPRKLAIPAEPVVIEEAQIIEAIVEEVVAEEEPEPESFTRRDLRPEVREEDPRTRAARRAAEIRNHGNVDDDGVDEFFVDPAVIPPGVYENGMRGSKIPAPPKNKDGPISGLLSVVSYGD